MMSGMAADRDIDGGDARRPGLHGVRLVLIFIGVWIVCGAFGALLLIGLDYRNQATYSQLEQHGVAVMARVTGTEPANHNTVLYSFVANGKTYSSGDRSELPNPYAGQLSVGDRVHVVYDRLNPTVSCACDPHRAAAPSRWWRRLLAGLYIGSVIAVVITLGIRRRREREGAGPNAPRRPHVASE